MARQAAWETVRSLPIETRQAIALLIRGSDVTEAGDPDDVETRLGELADRMVDEALTPWEKIPGGGLIYVG